MKDRKLTGWHVLAMFCTGFGIIITVNMILAFSAVRTFPGLEVKNSYVASQSFDRDRAAQEALGWDVSANVEDDFLVLRIDDDLGPISPQITRATLGRATHVGDDRELNFKFDGTAHFAGAADLAPGNWNLRFAAVTEDGTEFKQRIILRVKR
ncbi:MAG: FixH family protein [Pseudomonadota bacterium]